jgi:hypothetical protein
MMLYPRLFVRLLFSILPAVAVAQGGRAGLGLSANGTSEAEVFRGWPLLVEVHARLESDEPAVLQWPSPIRLTIRDANAAVNWPLQLAGTPEGVATVTGDRPVAALWVLSADATLDLKVGDYTMRADHPDAGGSRIVLLKVSEEPAELSLDQGSLKARLRSRYEEVTGSREVALQILTDWLATRPNDIAVLSQKADLLDDMERFGESLTVAEQALQAFREQFKDATHPPFGLLRRISVLQGKLGSQ